MSPNPTTQKTKSQQSHALLRAMIISGEFRPENNWSLRKLAAKLKMSVVPIAESLRRLEQEGIIEVRPQRGISVRILTPQELQELKLIREGLEVQAARLLAIYQPKAKIKKLRLKAQKIQDLLKKKKGKEAAYVDFELHQELIEAANCPQLTDRYDQLATLSMISTGSWNPSWLNQEVQGHSNHMLLVEAIESGDPEKADHAIRNHLRSVADKFEEKK